MNWLSQSFLVGVGGFIGANLRYWIGGLVLAIRPGSFPWQTFIVNFVGSFFIGVVMAWLIRQGGNDPIRLFVAVGLLGGFTTMSAFSFEVLSLLRTNQTGTAVGYAILTMLICVAASWAGTMSAGRTF
ncbi:MAG: fluoride efflux transporter CrcB [Fimbriimonadales bacterium]